MQLPVTPLVVVEDGGFRAVSDAALVRSCGPRSAARTGSATWATRSSGSCGLTSTTRSPSPGGSGGPWTGPADADSVARLDMSTLDSGNGHLTLGGPGVE